MKKELVFVVASLFAFILFLGMVSAAITVTGVPGSIEQTDGSFEITVTSDQDETVTLGVSDITQREKTVSFTLDKTSLTLNNSNDTVTVSYTIEEGFEFDLGKEYTSTITFNGSVSNEVAKDVDFKTTNFCEFGKKGDLEITEVNIDNIGDGDDTEWEFLDEIEIEITVENTDDEDSVSNVEAEIRILDEEGNDVTSEFLDDSDDKILDGYGKIRDDTEESEIVNLMIEPGIEEGKYRIYVKAYKENNEDEHCVQTNDDFEFDTYEIVEVLTGDKEVGYNNLDFPETISCGSSATVSLDFYNFDLSDKEEDMRVSLFNHELGLNEYTDKFDLRKGKDKKLYFNVEIPQDAQAKEYRIKVYYDYDYDDEDDVYDESDEADDTFNIVVDGNCYVELTPTVTAQLASEEVIEGEEVIIKSTITNDDADAMFTLSAIDYDSWAELIEINPQVAEIKLDESKEFTFKFRLKDDSAGEQMFRITVTSGGRIVSTQSVALTVEEGSFDLGSFVKNWDWTTIGIVALNVILLIAIILVARSILKKN